MFRINKKSILPANYQPDFEEHSENTGNWFLQSVLYKYDKKKNGEPKKAEFQNAKKFLMDYDLWDPKKPNVGHFRQKSEHGEFGSIDITENYMRFRQFDPRIFDNLNHRVVTIDGPDKKVKYIIYILKS